MTPHSLFAFLFLFSYSLFLLSAAAENCGYLGEITFPFTTPKNKNPEGGLQIIDCDKEVHRIKLGKQSYEICYIYHDCMNYSIFISIRTAAKIPLDFPHTPSSVTNNVKFSVSYYNYTYSPLEPYRPPRLLACSPLQPGDVVAPDPSSCLHSTLFLEIRVELSKFCEKCYHPNWPPFPLRPSLCSGNDSPSAGTKDKERPLTAAVIGLSIGLAFALFIIFLLYNRTNKSSGIQYQPTSSYSGLYRNTTHPESGTIYFGIPVFSYEELQEATNNFDQARVLGEGGFGIVYYGKLRDGREVAVKRLIERNYRPVESFINEIQILTRMRHRNLVTLYGCSSRHSRELLLVYEYVPNGTVSYHLFGDTAKHGLLPWPVRMKIAIETASALAYLHACDIIHRDVKSSNILLENNFGVKVADFGLSRLFPSDVTHVSTAPRGTPGYVDPDYRLCYQLTSKSDVYSFGVVLVELLSSLPAVDMNRDRSEINLANLATRKIQRSAFCELIDPSLGFQTDDQLKKMIISVAELAFQCLQRDKDLRPSMDVVLEVLQRIESGKDEPGNLEGIDVHGAGVLQTDAHPSLPNTLTKPQRHHQTL